MLKHGILGLLNYKEMSGYEIMVVFRDSLNFFWQAQTSQIYRELQSLKKCGWVTDVTVPQQGKPDKNIFSVTEAGKLELKRWLSDDNMEPNKNPLLMRTFSEGNCHWRKTFVFSKQCRRILSAFSKKWRNLL